MTVSRMGQSQMAGVRGARDPRHNGPRTALRPGALDNSREEILDIAPIEWHIISLKEPGKVEPQPRLAVSYAGQVFLATSKFSTENFKVCNSSFAQHLREKVAGLTPIEGNIASSTVDVMAASDPRAVAAGTPAG